MKKLIVLVDTSYIQHFTFYSAMNWYKREFNVTDAEITEKYPDQFDPFNDGDYAEDFKAFFATRFEEVMTGPLCSRCVVNTPEDYYLIMDCPREEIWRKELCPDYKGTRAAAAKKRNTSMRGLYSYLHQELFPALEAKGYNIGQPVPNAEADDVIGTAVRIAKDELRENNVIVITGDSDLYQLASDCTIYDGYGTLMDLNKVLKPYLDSKTKQIPESLKNITPEEYIILKSWSGDKADNIASIHTRCGPKTALKYWEDTGLLQKKIEADSKVSERIQENIQIMDIKYLPPEIVDGCHQEVNRLFAPIKAYMSK